MLSLGIVASEVLEVQKSATPNYRASYATDDDFLNADIHQIISKVLLTETSIPKSPIGSFAGNSLATDKTYIGFLKDMPKRKSQTSGRVKQSEKQPLLESQERTSDLETMDRMHKSVSAYFKAGGTADKLISATEEAQKIASRGKMFALKKGLQKVGNNFKGIIFRKSSPT